MPISNFNLVGLQYWRSRHVCLHFNFFIHALLLVYDNVLFVDNSPSNCYSHHTCCAPCSLCFWLNFFVHFLVSIWGLVSASIIIVCLVRVLVFLSTLCERCFFFLSSCCPLCIFLNAILTVEYAPYI